jgi:hypothetical protein
MHSCVGAGDVSRCAHAVPHCALARLCHVSTCCVVLWRVVLFFAMLCHAVLGS